MANPNYYTNPAFCQQSEFYNRRALSPERRHPPIGAHQEGYTREALPRLGPKPKIIQQNNRVQIKIGHDDDNNEPEELLVDDPLVYTESQKYLDLSNGNVYEEPLKDRYVDNQPQRQQKNRYEYIPMQEPPQTGYPSSPRKQIQERVHRYAVIPGDEEKPKNRYALVPVSEIKPNSRYAVVTGDEINRNGRYEFIPDVPEMYCPQTPRKGNPVATQKLHELLTTPKKVQRSQSMKTPAKVITPRITTPDPFRTPQKFSPTCPTSSPRIASPPKAQQKLNYTLSTRQPTEKRHTAIISPICSSPVQSVYSETTISKTSSCMNLSLQKPPVQATLAVAAVMMILCGGLTAGLCFYMVSVVGRMYYLDFGTVSGFSCLLLGLVGFRSRNCHWLPNRNYISGYIVLSAFSLLTCAGLVVLLALQPKPGSPLADVTSGAVCGISGLSLILASAGVVASFCLKYPPPDNRVQHCARGFTV